METDGRCALSQAPESAIEIEHNFERRGSVITEAREGFFTGRSEYRREPRS